jgi:hypothetical protein
MRQCLRCKNKVRSLENVFILIFFYCVCYLLMRQCLRCKNEVRSLENVFILIFFYCVCYLFILWPVHGHPWRLMPLPCLAALHWMQSIANKREMKKLVRTNVFFCFWHEIHFKTMNNCCHCSLADIDWLFLPSPNSDPLSSPLFT